MEYDKVEDGVDILGKPNDCPLKSVNGLIAKVLSEVGGGLDDKYIR